MTAKLLSLIGSIGSLGLRQQAAMLLALSLAVLASAYGSQYFAGLEPCELCLYQRWPWWIAAALAALGATLFTGAKRGGGLIILAGLAILAGAGIAFYHVGVEQHWWKGLAACTGGTIPADFAEMQRMAATPVVPCDEPAWTLFGISMAGYNGLLSLMVGGLALYGGIAALRSKGKTASDG
jgi:disulfide bond formation protein DsbB